MDETEKLIVALKAIVEAYKKAMPVRTADYHRIDCKCLRCAVDWAEILIKDL